jgi:hypothetical protein
LADLAAFDAFRIQAPEGGWYVPLRLAPRLIPAVASSVDALAVLLHYGGADPDSGIGLLPGELFGHRDYRDGFLLRGTLTADDEDRRRFITRLREATTALCGPDGRARAMADLDTILANSRY